MRTRRSAIALALALATLAIPAGQVCAEASEMPEGCPMGQMRAPGHAAMASDGHTGMHGGQAPAGEALGEAPAPCHKAAQPVADCCLADSGPGTVEGLSFGTPRAQAPAATTGFDALVAPTFAETGPLTTSALPPPRDRHALLSIYLL